MAAGIHYSNAWINSQFKQIRTVFNRTNPQAPVLWKDWLPVVPSDQERNFFQLMQVYGLGYFQVLPEGGSPALDASGEGPITYFPKVMFSLKYGITKIGRRHDPHKLTGRLPKYLKYSKFQTQEQLYWNILTQSFNPAFPIWDGQPLISANHTFGAPQSSGLVYSNFLGNVSLTVESHFQARVLFAMLQDDRQLATYRDPVKLISVPPYGQVVETVLGTKYKPKTADNDINTEYGTTTPLLSRYIPTAAQGPFPWWLSADPGQPGEDCHGSFVVLSDEWEHEWYDDDTDTLYHRAGFETSWGSYSPDGLVGSGGA